MAYSTPHRPLRNAELYGGLATGLEAILRMGYVVASYTCTDIYPDAQAAVAHRLSRLRVTYPHLLLSEAILNWATTMRMNTGSISHDVFNATLPEGVDIILASPPRMTKHYPNPYRGITPQVPDATQRLAHLILHLVVKQRGGVGFIWSTTKLQPPTPRALSLLGEGSLIEAHKCGSGAYRATRI